MESIYNQWIQPQQQQSSSSSSSLLQDSPSTTALHEQQRPPTSTSLVESGASNPAATSPPDPTHAIDIDEYTSLALGATSPYSSAFTAPPPSTTSSTAFSHSAYPTHTGFFYPTASPFNTIAYGSAWSSLPISSFSTLNGANPSAAIPSSSSSQPQPQPPPQQQQRTTPATQPTPMVIDPALTTTNGTTTTSPPQYTPPPISNGSTSTSSQLQRNPYFQTFSLPDALSLTSAYLHYAQQAQSHATSQGTLSPQVLQAPAASSSSLSSILPSSFYTASSPPISVSASNSSSSTATVTPPTPQELKQQFQAAIKPLLVSSAFTGAGAVNALVDRIEDYGPNTVDASIRLEILTKIRDGAGNHYFRAWAENNLAMDITREWLKAAFVAKPDDPLLHTTMPLLHLIDRLPLTLEMLKSSKLGKIIVKLVKDPPSPAVKDMASNIERRWRSLLTSQDNGSKPSESIKSEDTKTKKRKLNDQSMSKAVPPQKKLATGTGSSVKPTVKKEAKPTSAPVKDAKSDSSFFSAPKPKPKLPSFKKAPPPAVPVKKEPDTNIAQPSSIDPFQEALKSMAKARKDSPMHTPPPMAPTPTADTPSQSFNATKPPKKRKSVTWAPDGQLESIRLIEKAIYDDDPVDGAHIPHSNLRDLDRAEGAALHAHVFEETVDWSEPIPFEIPDSINVPPRGEQSEERQTQEHREQTVLSAVYLSPQHIPESPSEPSQVLSEEEIYKDTQMMTCGPEADAYFWQPEPAAAAPPQAPSAVNDLLGQMSSGAGMDYSQSQSGENGGGGDVTGLGNTQFSLEQIAAIAQQMPHLQSLLQQLGNTQASQPQEQPQRQQQLGDQSWQSYSEFGQPGYHDADASRDQWSSDRGRGGGRGRGRGRGRDDGGGYRHSKKRLCTFFAAGRCRYGDQCDFAHETANGGIY